MTTSPWANLITHSKKLDDGISLMNAIPINHFEEILRKIYNNEEFDQTEVKYLEEQLEIDETKIRYIAQTISYIQKQLAKVILKPTDLKRQLIEYLEINKDKAVLFVNYFTESIRTNFDLESKAKLEHISWELNIQAASRLYRKESIPNATIQLKVSNRNPSENIILQLDEEELTYFFNTLENIQGKLDTV